MPHAALWVVQQQRLDLFLAPFLVSMPHAALWVVQLNDVYEQVKEFDVSMPHAALWVVQHERDLAHRKYYAVSMPHAALWVVQHGSVVGYAQLTQFQCRTRLCGWCNFVALSSCPPKRKKPFWKVSGNLSVLTENM